MKHFKDILSEVGQPKAPEEKRFKNQHEIEKIDHPVALDSQFTGDIEGLTPKKRPADNAKGDDAKAYDQAYRKKVSQTLPKRGNTIVVDDEDLTDDVDWTEEEINALAEEVAKYDLEDLTEEELDEVIGRAAKAIGRGIKRQTIDRFTTSGQAGRAERQADKLERKMKAKERLKKAQERLQKAKDAIQKAKEAEQKAARSESVDIEQMSITEILGFKNKKPEEKWDDEYDKIMGDEDPNDAPDAVESEEGYDESACVEDMVKLHASGCSKHEMYEKIKEKYGCSKSTFEGLYASNCMGEEEKVEEETETDSADTLDAQPDEAPKVKSDKLSPSAVEIGVSGGRKIKVTFKEMLDKISTEEELLESPQEEIPMMMKQLHFICYASEEISEYLKSGVDPEEWWQNKLADVFSNVKSLYAWSKGDQLVNPVKKISAAAIFDKAGMLGFSEAIELEESSIRVSGNKVNARAGQAKLDNGKRVKVDKNQAQLLNDFFKQLKPKDAKEMSSKLLADEESYNEVLQFAEITIG
jgi:hypothetical protein